MITVNRKVKGGGGVHYVDVEMIGDPDLYDTYETKTVPGNKDALDVNINGDWARLPIESDPLTVREHVD